MRPMSLPLITLFVLNTRASLWADGGAVRLSQREGNYQITVLTAPTPLRAGPIDVSVLVQTADTNALVSDAKVTVNATRRGHAGQAVLHLATTEEATNKLFRAANFELHHPGLWEFEVTIDGPLGDANAHFEAEVGEPLPKWLAMWPWFSWPALIIALFGVNQLLVHLKRFKTLNVPRRPSDV